MRGLLTYIGRHFRITLTLRSCSIAEVSALLSHMVTRKVNLIFLEDHGGFVFEDLFRCILLVFLSDLIIARRLIYQALTLVISRSVSRAVSCKFRVEAIFQVHCCVNIITRGFQGIISTVLRSFTL